MTADQKERLAKNKKEALARAQILASQWHVKSKQQRLVLAEQQAFGVLANIDIGNRYIIDLALAMLYLGEGFKRNLETGIGNTDPLIIKFFLSALKRIYNLDLNKIRCELHLRIDQDPILMKKYWAEELNLPIENFKYVYFDKRTANSKTINGYKGVCMLRCANVAIQRKLINISREFCKRVIERL